MGNENCNNFEEIKYENQAYGEYEKIIIDDKQVVRIVKIVEKQSKNINEVENQLIRRFQINHKNICKLYSYEIKQESFVFQILFQYQYYPYSLADKIYSMNKSFFEEKQLIKLINQISQGLKYLYKNKIIHGCINMNTILCTKDGYKITDVSSTSYLTLLQLVQRGSKDQPISDKIISFVNDITLKKIILPAITISDDLFSLGMIALSIATATNIQDFYKYDKIDGKLYVRLKYNIIIDYLYLVRKRYNKNIQNIIKKLLFKKQISISNNQFFTSLNGFKIGNQTPTTNQKSNFSIKLHSGI